MMSIFPRLRGATARRPAGNAIFDAKQVRKTMVFAGFINGKSNNFEVPTIFNQNEYIFYFSFENLALM